MAIFLLPFLALLIESALKAFYLVHVIKNNQASETLRVILGVGCFFMPFIAMPVYYFTYIWPQTPPAWALQSQTSSAVGARLEELQNEKDPDWAAISAGQNEPSIVEKIPGGIDVYTFAGIEFVKIPKGPFLMGSKKNDESAYDDEKPQFTLELPYDYWMGRVPVTNAQYAIFTGKVSEIPEEKHDHPLVNISWYDAMQYIDWLNETQAGSLPAGYCYSLPSEAEWEKAARGTDGRRWPWGNQFDKSRCNIEEGGKGDTTPVGVYSPRGDSPYGCADMAGNVWEWTRSLHKSYPYDSKDGREDLQSSESRVVRGGSWNDLQWDCQCANRLNHNPVSVWNGYGFRVCLSSL